MWGGGCQVDTYEPSAKRTITRDKDAIKIMQAQSWLEQNSPLTNKDQQTWRHYWAMAFSESSENWETVEIPLEFLEMPVIILPENMEMFEQTGGHSYLANSKRTVVATNTETGEMTGFFMNVVPSLQYLQENSFDPLTNSYLDRDEDFDGMVLFYSLQGEFINGWTYSQGEITGALLYETDDPGTQQEKNDPDEQLWLVCSGIKRIHFIDWTNGHTGEDWGTTISGITYESMTCYLVWTPTGDGEPIDHIVDDPTGGGTGFTIAAGAYPTYAGEVEGSATYVPYSAVQLAAVPKNEAFEFALWEEIHKDPDDDNPPVLPFNPYEATVSFLAERHMIVKAVFSQLYPCEGDGVFAPFLGTLQVAPTQGQRISGGLFEAHRHGNRPHGGLDIAAPVGSTIFAMTGGTIVGGNLYVTGQPNRIYDSQRRKHVYPPGYSGDENNAGNRIYILSSCGNYQYAYWHLCADNPVAINPNTGAPWGPGDTVNPGDPIATLGVTGNAIGGNPHLHLGVRTWQNGKWVWLNPAQHFSSIFQNINTNTGQITIPCN